jgi:protein-S-isoprenylcysteine O-methyltransferase Ste14
MRRSSPMNDGSHGDLSQDVSSDIKMRALKGIAKTAAPSLAIIILLFASAGRLDWTMAWVYAGLSLIGVVAGALAAGPSLLAERSGVGQGAQALDVIMAIIMAWLGPVATGLVAGFDFRYGWRPDVPSLVQGVGALAAVLGYAVVLWAMASNRFFSGVVRIQAERGHTVVSHGPYAVVRHPGYVGVILAALGAPLMLGSAWAMIPAVATIGVIVIRTAYEDRTLMRDLAGYEAYARRVRYRLLPGVW